MIKTAAVALSAAFGIAAVAHARPVQADPYVRVGIRVPGLVVVAPLVRAPVYYRSYRYGYAIPYWRWNVDRDDFDHRHGDWHRHDYDPRRERRRGERHER
ncbi:MAG TPA: hypothetical protein VND80_01690 [Steroidobacteraceae bacterium]|nr:hypothetical protein [Steroidobacteraceae bacterium]